MILGGQGTTGPLSIGHINQIIIPFWGPSTDSSVQGGLHKRLTWAEPRIWDSIQGLSIG